VYTGKVIYMFKHTGSRRTRGQSDTTSFSGYAVPLDKVHITTTITQDDIGVGV